MRVASERTSRRRRSTALRRAPACAAAPADGTTVGLDALYGATLSRMYAPSRWPSLGATLAAATHGDGGPLLSLSRAYFGITPGSDHLLRHVANAVNSADHPVGRDVGQIAEQARAAAVTTPQFRPYLASGAAICAVWPVPPSRTPHPVRAAGSPPIVVVATTDDPATPFAWGQALATQLEHGVLLTRAGTGHVALLASDCVRARVSDYLVTAAPPAPGTTC